MTAEEKWPPEIVTSPSEESLVETKPVREIFNVAVPQPDPFDQLLKKWSLWKTLRIYAWISRFPRNAGKQYVSIKGPLLTEEIKEQETWWINRVQTRNQDSLEFKEDRARLNLRLTGGILTCHGRIQGDFPIYLPDNDLYTEKRVEHSHIGTLHGGVNLTMTKVRLAKRIIKRCFGCKRFQTVPCPNPQPGKLPKDRTEGDLPFQVVGVDYAGPIRYRSRKKKEAKAYISVLAPIVHDIITASIKQCKYPSCYKHGLVTPVPKVYPPVDISNDVRQVSVLPHIVKILERVQSQLNQKDILLRPSQHGFTKDRSTTSALIAITQPWFNATDGTSRDKAGIHALFIDFRQAFDLIDHGILLNKLALMNVNKSFWIWVKSFSSGRTQQIKLNQSMSSIASFPAGVPQGSVLSPTLFNIQIDDLDACVPEKLEISTHKYADDCTQSECIMKGECSNMQEVLDSVQNWSNVNKMKLNVMKTKDMWICCGKSIPEPPNLYIGENMIERVNSFKLLGVGCQSNMKWNSHIKEITRKGNRRPHHLRQC